MLLLLLALAYGGVSAFSPSGGVDSISYKSSALLSTNKSRRTFLSTLQYPLLSSLYLPIANAASVPVQQAVGSAESKCREEGNCLEKGELDGGTCKYISCEHNYGEELPSLFYNVVYVWFVFCIFIFIY